MNKLFLTISIIYSLTLISCGSSAEKKQDDGAVPHDTTNGVSAMAHDSLHSELAYVCPCGGCPEIKETKPGKCSKCGMSLVEKKK